jgi:RNA polymerase subunit RPABC4/transcription elongation factor Spt4
MAFGIVILVISAIWAVILATKTADVFGQKVLVLGNNMLESNTYALSSAQYVLFWALAIGGIIFGIIILLNSGSRESEPNSTEDQLRNKKCPQCAEYVKYEAKICKHCKYQFSEEEINFVTEKLSKAKYCPRCNNDFSLDEEFCPICACDLFLK